MRSVSHKERKERKGARDLSLAEAQRHRGWELRRLKSILRPHKTIVGKRCNEYNLLSLSLRGVIKRDMDNPGGKFPASFETYQEVSPGDFIFCMFDNEETPRAVGLSSLRGMITGAYDVMSLIDDGVNKDFLNYYFLWVDDGKRLKPLYKGLRKTVPLDSFLASKIPLPPLPEQEAIVKYLDEATGKIDKAIEAEEKMVALLQERREIVINEAVGGGQDFSAETQRRGVRRELPKGRELRRLRHCFAKMFSGLWGTDPSSDNSGIVCFRVADFDYARGGISGDKLTYRAYRNCEVASRLVEKGDLLLEKSGGGDNSPVGRVVITDNEFTATCSNFIQALHCKAGYSSKYLCYIFRSLYSRKVNGYYYNQTTGIQNLKVAEYLSVEVPIPPLPEQEAIVKRLDEETGKIDCAIAVKRRQIELLRERREIIINEVVTGKVKVV